MKVALLEDSSIDIDMELIAIQLAHASVSEQRDFLQAFFGEIDKFTFGVKHREAIFRSLLLDNGTSFKSALRCGL